MPVPTPPFTTGNDFINLYEYFDGTSGPVGNEKTLAVLGKTFEMGTGVDEIYIDASYSRMGSWFNITATETGLITLTNASGGTVKVAGAERIQLTNLTINLGTAAADTVNGSTGSDKFLFGLGGRDTIYGFGGSDTLWGGSSNDVLVGGDGDDKLYGGTGNDTLTGSAGMDQFVFDSVLNASTNVDKITGLSSADKIVLDNDIFTGLGASMTTDEFRSIATGTSFASVDASDNIIYLKQTGDLYYDRDGSGTTYAPILFADLSASTVVNFSHFGVIE